MSEVTIRIADLDNEQDAQAVLAMTRAYAQDPMGGGCDLEEDIQQKLIAAMRAHPGVLSFVAYENVAPVGIANCILSFSTFLAKTVVNIHDLSVLPDHRGKGVSRALLDAVESHAKKHGYACVTLEVLEVNHHARKVYSSMGFADANPEPGKAKFFCRKVL